MISLKSGPDNRSEENIGFRSRLQFENIVALCLGMFKSKFKTRSSKVARLKSKNSRQKSTLVTKTLMGQEIKEKGL
jgi:hypothetical protein